MYFPVLKRARLTYSLGSDLKFILELELIITTARKGNIPVSILCVKGSQVFQLDAYTR